MQKVPRDLVTGATVMTMLDMRGGEFNDAFRKGLIKPEIEIPGKHRSTTVRLYRLTEVERFRRVRAENGSRSRGQADRQPTRQCLNVCRSVTRSR